MILLVPSRHKNLLVNKISSRSKIRDCRVCNGYGCNDEAVRSSEIEK